MEMAALPAFLMLRHSIFLTLVIAGNPERERERETQQSTELIFLLLCSCVTILVCGDGHQRCSHAVRLCRPGMQLNFFLLSLACSDFLYLSTCQSGSLMLSNSIPPTPTAWSFSCCGVGRVGLHLTFLQPDLLSFMFVECRRSNTSSMEFGFLQCWQGRLYLTILLTTW